MNRDTEIFLNSIPNDNLLDRTKFKAFADYKFNIAKIMIFVIGRVEIVWAKKEMLVIRVVKSWDFVIDN